MQKRFYEKEQINKLLVINKPMFISSNNYLNTIKRKYKNKKAGFSGTLDPFAKGCLIVAFGQYAKLFKYLSKAPKTYKAVIWLGVESESLDIERVLNVGIEDKMPFEKVKNELEKLKGKIEYTPPKFSAKKINGKKAYDLARQGVEFEMKTSIMNVLDIKLLNYNHPFITFEAQVSEGTYIRSLAQMFLEKIEKVGTLSYLERLNEGKFFYENEKELDPLDFIDIPLNKYFGTKDWMNTGKTISLDYLENKENGQYIVLFEESFSIIEINGDEVKYILNRIPRIEK